MPKGKLGFLQKTLIFLVIYLIVSSLVGTFFTTPEKSTTPEKWSIEIDKEIATGASVSATIYNNTNQEISIKNRCPLEPLKVSRYLNGKWESISHSTKVDCAEAQNFKISPNSSLEIPFTYWSITMFSELGRYKLATEIMEGNKKIEVQSNEFEIVKPSIFRLFWNYALYIPILNVLIFLISIMPGYDLGLAIILLTIFIRTLLLLPSQKAMKAQKKLQEIQPKLEEIRTKYKGNQEKIAQETMKIWQSHKVNPFGSCLPMLIQFPLLIALFYVIQSGLNPDQQSLLYGSLRTLDFTQINTNFLGILELTAINTFFLPLVVGLLQFLQMKLSFKKPQGKNDKKSEMEMANGVMLYFLPVMIAIFTASLPAGVGIYWAVSTIYSAAQQFIVNQEKPTKEDIKVKVIE